MKSRVTEREREEQTRETGRGRERERNRGTKRKRERREGERDGERRRSREIKRGRERERAPSCVGQAWARSKPRGQYSIHIYMDSREPHNSEISHCLSKHTSSKSEANSKDCEQHSDREYWQCCNQWFNALCYKVGFSDILRPPLQIKIVLKFGKLVCVM